MLQINNFSTLFEIAASLNVAFIAVEYATSYTESVAKNVFKFFDKIQEGINHCKKYIDKETIDHLRDVEINGHSITHKIEKVKRESEKISKEIDQLNDSLRSSVREKCQLKCFSMVCFHLFLYCLTAALIGAYEEDTASSIEILWVIFSLLSFLYILSSFILGEIMDVATTFFQNIKWNLLAYIGIVCASLATTHFIGDTLLFHLDFFWNVFVTATSIYPFVFFLLFIWILKHNSKSINGDIDAKVRDLENKCRELENEVKKLSSVQELSIEVEDTSIQTEFQQLSQQKLLPSGRLKNKSNEKKK